MKSARLGWAVAVAALLLGSGPLRAAAPGTAAWDRMQNSSAADAVRNDALARAARAADGTRGGCARLPAGWARFDVTVTFPPAYRGYASWVNSAELLPAGADVRRYVATGQAPGVMVRPAGPAGAMAVRSDMCAPGGRSYWLVVDSGRARVAVGRLALGPGPGPYHFAVTAPPLGR